MTYFRQY